MFHHLTSFPRFRSSKAIRHRNQKIKSDTHQISFDRLRLGINPTHLPFVLLSSELSIGVDHRYLSLPTYFWRNTITMGLTSRRIQRLITFSVRPLLAAVVFTIFLHWLTRDTKSPHTPKPKDTHPHLTKHLVVASTLSSNLTWLYPSLRQTHWEPYIYVTDDPHALTVPKNKGNEAMVYLTYIIDNYHNLPDVM